MKNRMYFPKNNHFNSATKLGGLPISVLYPFIVIEYSNNLT